MRYEKKMLILSGEGKGVVLIEKSALGVRFSVTTFDMPVCGELKAGIITRRGVFVRDLPKQQNPSAVFMLDTGEAAALHFAVFDAKLRLYGTDVKPMWEANVMDLLHRSERRPPLDERPPLAPLPPISEPPRVLPLPDGTGIPQTRLELYGDEALAEADFYTPLDIASRLPIVDKFLDTPRVLEGLAPVIEPPEIPFAETTATAVLSEPETEESAQKVEADNAAEPRESRAAQRGDSDAYATASADVNASPQPPQQSPQQSPQQPTDVQADAAATCDAAVRRPWELEAQWLKSRGRRSLRRERAEIKPVAKTERVKPLRETTFIERAKDDIELLFSSAEKDEKLSELLPDMQWVRVETDGHTISVGRSGNAFLCYAVAGTYEKVSPLGDEAQWLPGNKSIPTGKGYWLIFQNASNGDIVK